MKTLIPAIIAAISLTACGGADTSSPEAPKTASAAKPAKAELSPVERGAKVYKKCRTCHTLDQDGKNKVGPNLWDIYGMKAGTKDGFNYSKAMKESGITWDESTMDAYLKKPRDYMPGNRMTFIGLKKQEDRDAVQAYMREKTTP